MTIVTGTIAGIVGIGEQIYRINSATVPTERRKNRRPALSIGDAVAVGFLATIAIALLQTFGYEPIGLTSKVFGVEPVVPKPIALDSPVDFSPVDRLSVDVFDELSDLVFEFPSVS